MKKEKQPVYLYDMSIGDVQLRNKLKIEYPSIKDAANFLGYPPNKLSDIIRLKNYAYHRDTRAKYAVRVKPVVKSLLS